MNLEQARIGYAPYDRTLNRPGDRRRFCFYARTRGLSFEIVSEPSPDFDVVLLSSVADITRWAGADPSVTIVYDLIDSYLAVPWWNSKRLGRGLAKRLSGETSRLAWSYHRAIEAMCSRANAVVCSTPEQQETIFRHCSNVHVILDHHGQEAAARKRTFDAHDPFRIVWEGLPNTLYGFSEVNTILQRLKQRHNIAIHLVTDLEFKRFANRFGSCSTREFAARFVDDFELHKWRLETLANTVTSCDLAIIPVPLDDPFFAGKPENKLLLFWRMALPTVTSATPAYERAMSQAGLDMSCADLPSWEAMLERYITDHAAREQAGEQGYRFVSAEHSERRLVERWDAMFASVGFKTDDQLATAS